MALFCLFVQGLSLYGAELVQITCSIDPGFVINFYCILARQASPSQMRV